MVDQEPDLELPDDGLSPTSQSVAERIFPTIMRYAGLSIALFEGFIDRPPQYLRVGLATSMMSIAQVADSIIKRRK